MTEFQPYPEWYKQWMDYHLGLFCIDEAVVSAAFMRWWPAFEAMNVTPEEMKQATDYFHREGDSPHRIAQHFDRMLQQIADIRTKRDNLLAIKREQAAVDTVGACDNCGETGWVCVPHGKNLIQENGEWSWRLNHYSNGNLPIHYEMVVTCTCPKGIKIQSRYKDPPAAEPTGKKKRKSTSEPKVPPLSLERFEQIFTPDWRRLMRVVAAAKKTIDQTIMDNQNLATDLIDSIAKGTKLPPKPKPKGRKK